MSPRDHEEERMRAIAKDELTRYVESREFYEVMCRVVDRAVLQTLKNLGLDTETPVEMRKDFEYIRDGRMLWRMIKNRGIITVLIMLLGALGTVLVAGLDKMFGH